MLKKRYENASLQIISLETADVIRTSQNPELPEDPRENLLDIDFFG